MSRKVYLIFIVIALVAVTAVSACLQMEKKAPMAFASEPNPPYWVVPDTNQLVNNDAAKLIKYGRSLIVNTAYYLGPKGIIAHKSNGMNCQNCHLDAGTRFFGNNFSKVSTSYPKFKDRSGTVETMVKKVEDCFERSLNGNKIDSNSREMKAFIAYLNWIGKNVKKGIEPAGSGIRELPFLKRPADTLKGRMVYVSRCQVCHGKNGEGLLNQTGTVYTYPPLWGDHSYNIGASIYRLSKLAGFVKFNMPFKIEHTKRLTDEQA
ncbi:MAG: c-type cytochrome, partial [Mucilaginibacter sp.]